MRIVIKNNNLYATKKDNNPSGEISKTIYKDQAYIYPNKQVARYDLNIAIKKIKRM